MTELKFNIKKTSKGYMAQCVEIPAIIIETKTKDNLNRILGLAVTCYFESFPEEYNKIFSTEKSEESEK